MNRKDRAINLGLKINSLKGNLSVAKSVIKELEIEINTAVIDEDDRKKLLVLYSEVVNGLKSVVSPSVEIRNKVNQLIEDANIKVKSSKSYIEADSVEGMIKKIEAELKNKVLKKEHKAALRSKLESLEDSHKKRIGHYLKRNFEKMMKEINDECRCENPYHVSVVIKELNKKIKITPLFHDDRHTLQALLDTNWQKASRDIAQLKQEEN